MEQLRKKAKSLGALDFGISQRKNKRFYVLIHNGLTIHFGSKNGNTFIDHHNELVRTNWKSRHSKIKNKQGQLVYKNPDSPSYWSWNILW